MRVEPIFALLVAAPLLLAGLAIAPVSWSGARDDAAIDPAPAQPTDLPTDWVSGFVERLEIQQQHTPVQPESDPLEDWRLVGLVQGDDGSWVTLIGGGEVRTLSLGEMLMGFELVAVSGDIAVFRRDDEERTLRLRR